MFFEMSDTFRKYLSG